MSVLTAGVVNRADMRQFIRFPYRLYGDNPYWIPPLMRDEWKTLSAKWNPVFEQAEARLFLAKKDGKTAGRIAAIISHAANEKYRYRNMRFGWFDSINDAEVAASLFDSAAAWGKSLGMTTMTGPQGFTDLDPAGMLIEGFDEPATISTIYNHPYYPDLVERCGFEKEIDYVEFQSLTSEGTVLPKRMEKIAEWCAKRNDWRLVSCSNTRDLQKRYGMQLFDLLDESYKELYGTVPLCDRQKEYYIRKYLPFARPELIKLVCGPDDALAGFMVALPSLGLAFQKCRGRLFPFGFLRILRALKRYDSIDFMIAGVREGCREKGVDLVMSIDMFRTAVLKGVRLAESNPELETNLRIQNLWKIVATRQHKRRRIYRKSIV